MQESREGGRHVKGMEGVENAARTECGGNSGRTQP